MYTLYNVKIYLSSAKTTYNVCIRYCVGDNDVHFRIDEILKEKGKTRYWLYIQLGLSYQNFKKILENETKAIKFENLKAICDILECTPNDLFVEYYKK